MRTPGDRGNRKSETTQDRSDIERWFDEVGEHEWNRFAEDEAVAVSLEVHRLFLRRFVQPGLQALDVGARSRATTHGYDALTARADLLASPVGSPPPIRRVLPRHNHIGPPGGLGDRVLELPDCPKNTRRALRQPSPL